MEPFEKKLELSVGIQAVSSPKKLLESIGRFVPWTAKLPVLTHKPIRKYFSGSCDLLQLPKFSNSSQKKFNAVDFSQAHDISEFFCRSHAG